MYIVPFAKLKAAEAARDTLRQLIRDLQVHAREHGWQDYDEPIEALLSVDVTGEAPTPQGEAKEEWVVCLRDNCPLCYGGIKHKVLKKHQFSHDPQD